MQFIPNGILLRLLVQFSVIQCLKSLANRKLDQSLLWSLSTTTNCIIQSVYPFVIISPLPVNSAEFSSFFLNHEANSSSELASSENTILSDEMTMLLAILLVMMLPILLAMLLALFWQPIQ